MFMNKFQIWASQTVKLFLSIIESVAYSPGFCLGMCQNVSTNCGIATFKTLVSLRLNIIIPEYYQINFPFKYIKLPFTLYHNVMSFQFIYLN